MQTGENIPTNGLVEQCVASVPGDFYDPAQRPKCVPRGGAGQEEPKEMKCRVMVVKGAASYLDAGVRAR